MSSKPLGNPPRKLSLNDFLDQPETSPEPWVQGEEVMRRRQTQKVDGRAQQVLSKAQEPENPKQTQRASKKLKHTWKRIFQEFLREKRPSFDGKPPSDTEISEALAEPGPRLWQPEHVPALLTTFCKARTTSRLRRSLLTNGLNDFRILQELFEHCLSFETVNGDQGRLLSPHPPQNASALRDWAAERFTLHTPNSLMLGFATDPRLKKPRVILVWDPTLWIQSDARHSFIRTRLESLLPNCHMALVAPVLSRFTKLGGIPVSSHLLRSPSRVIPSVIRWTQLSSLLSNNPLKRKCPCQPLIASTHKQKANAHRDIFIAHRSDCVQIMMTNTLNVLQALLKQSSLEKPLDGILFTPLPELTALAIQSSQLAPRIHLTESDLPKSTVSFTDKMENSHIHLRICSHPSPTLNKATIVLDHCWQWTKNSPIPSTRQQQVWHHSLLLNGNVLGSGSSEQSDLHRGYAQSLYLPLSDPLSTAITHKSTTSFVSPANTDLFLADAAEQSLLFEGLNKHHSSSTQHSSKKKGRIVEECPVISHSQLSNWLVARGLAPQDVLSHARYPQQPYHHSSPRLGEQVNSLEALDTLTPLLHHFFPFLPLQPALLALYCLSFDLLAEGLCMAAAACWLSAHSTLGCSHRDGNGDKFFVSSGPLSILETAQRIARQQDSTSQSLMSLVVAAWGHSLGLCPSDFDRILTTLHTHSSLLTAIAFMVYVDHVCLVSSGKESDEKTQPLEEPETAHARQFSTTSQANTNSVTSTLPLVDSLHCPKAQPLWLSKSKDGYRIRLVNLRHSSTGAVLSETSVTPQVTAGHVIAPIAMEWEDSQLIVSHAAAILESSQMIPPLLSLLQGSLSYARLNDQRGLLQIRVFIPFQQRMTAIADGTLLKFSASLQTCAEVLELRDLWSLNLSVLFHSNRNSFSSQRLKDSGNNLRERAEAMLQTWDPSSTANWCDESREFPSTDWTDSVRSHRLQLLPSSHPNLLKFQQEENLQKIVASPGSNPLSHIISELASTNMPDVEIEYEP